MRSRFPVKRLPDGRAMLNVGCGVTMHWGWNNLDFSPYAFLAHHPFTARGLRMAGLFSPERSRRLAGVDPAIIRWDVRKGIPFARDTFDVVYHSHLLEHLDRRAAPGFLAECSRVLKPGGLIRVVVPDLAILVTNYLASTDALQRGRAMAEEAHEQAIGALFDQMVRREPTGTEQQRTLVRAVEGLVRGDAATTGEVHRWMYDRYSLARLLSAAGFADVRAEGAATSRIAGWETFGLDMDAGGIAHKTKSLYVEGVKRTGGPSG